MLMRFLLRSTVSRREDYNEYAQSQPFTIFTCPNALEDPWGSEVQTPPFLPASPPKTKCHLRRYKEIITKTPRLSIATYRECSKEK